MDRGRRKSITGIVSSDKMDKSRVIVVERRVKHPLYKKYVKRRQNLWRMTKKMKAMLATL